MSNSNISTAWGQEEKLEWLKVQTIKRSYVDEVIKKINSLKERFEVKQYGTLSYEVGEYDLYIVKSKNRYKSKKTILITGGVHGYETSGVQGALEFLNSAALKYSNNFNIIVAPCISPWGYETINRWNPNTIDPNRSFFKNGPSQECNLIMEEIASMNINIFAHIDLHETTDTDNTVFRPALEQRDAIKQEVWDIPDGFYLVGDSSNPSAEFQKAIIEAVRRVTHIAPSDENGKIIGEVVTQEGVINYPVKKINLCAGFSDAQYCTTTEVYPDSPKVTNEDCVNAQVTAVTGALNYFINNF